MEGYAKLASLMGAHPEVLFLRRFGALGAQNLLYLQAELVQLEHEFRECSRENERSNDRDRANFSKEWFTLAHANGGHERQWDIMLQIRKKLKEYGDALLQQSLLQQLKQPNPTALEFLQHWMKRPDMGCVYLYGRDSNIWEKPDLLDLVALKPQQSEGLFSSWLADHFLQKYHQTIGKYFRKPYATDSFANTVHYSQEGLQRVAGLIAMSIASILPIAAITVLYAVDSMPVRLAIIATFTVLFIIALGTLTKARFIDIFVATTAFAAVQVVFISNNMGTAAA